MLAKFRTGSADTAPTVPNGGFICTMLRLSATIRFFAGGEVSPVSVPPGEEGQEWPPSSTLTDMLVQLTSSAAANISLTAKAGASREVETPMDGMLRQVQEQGPPSHQDDVVGGDRQHNK